MKRTTQNTQTLRAALASAAFFIAACGDSPTEQKPIELPAPVAFVEVTPRTAQLTIGQNQSLSAILRAANRAILTGREVQWSSSAPAIVSISPSGSAIGVEAGRAWIRALSEGVGDSVQLEVKPLAVVSVVITPAAASLKIGDSTSLEAEARAADGRRLERPIAWTSSNPAIATVTASGKVVAMSAGIASIFALSEGVADTARITVTAPTLTGKWLLTVFNLDNHNTRCAVQGSTLTLTLATNGRGVTGIAGGEPKVQCVSTSPTGPFTTPFAPVGTYAGSLIDGSLAIRSDLEPTWTFSGKLSSSGTTITGGVNYIEVVDGVTLTRSGQFQLTKQ